MRFLKILLIFILGVAGGIWAQVFLLPFLADCPSFQNFQFVKNLKEREVVIHPKTEITLQENVALRNAVEKIEKVVIGVKTVTPEGEILAGSGLVVTADGLIITLADLVPQGSDFYFYVDGKWPAYQILKRDLKNNLALVKITDGGLSTAGFADLEKIRLGERVFLVGMEFTVSTSTATTTSLTPPKKVVNEGIVAAIEEDIIQTNIFEKPSIAGSPLFNIEGNIVGLCRVAEDGRISAIPITFIRQFIGL